MYGTLLDPGAEADLNAFTTSCISDQLDTFELNPIDGVTGLIKRVIIELNFSPGITVCISKKGF